MKGTVDSGEIINQKIIKINEDDTSNSLYKKIISIMQLQIDEIIDDSLWQKYQNMNDALDDNWPNTLDYDGNRVIISENQADNDFNSLYEHLKKFEK